MKRRMRKALLTKLADLLDDFKNQRPMGRVDMGEFGRHDGVGHLPREKNWCGTTACALGWATTIPEIRRAGLQGIWERAWDGEDVLTITYSRGADHLGKFHEIESGAAVFNIHPVISGHLFGGYTATRRKVVERLRYLIEHGEEAYIKKHKLDTKYGAGILESWT